MENITKAILKVMAEVKGIDKSLTVGAGRNAYKGVSDKDVKITIGGAMQKNGLAIAPTHIKPKTIISHSERTYNGDTKMVQSVFTEVETRYILLHESGESLDLSGYGHGIDSQDKGAGKATTYALKYTLLYLFLTPTGAIDDTDTTHSENIENVTEIPPITEWLSADQFEIAKDAPFKQLKATLSVYNGLKGKSMKREYRAELQGKFDKLSREEANNG